MVTSKLRLLCVVKITSNKTKRVLTRFENCCIASEVLSMESKMFEKFKRECENANDLLLKLMKVDRLDTVDCTVIEDGLGVISGFNRSMKYLFGPKILEELESRCHTDESAGQSHPLGEQRDVVENINNLMNNEIKTPISSNNHKNILNVQNNFSNKNNAPERCENWIITSSKESLPPQPKLKENVPTFCFITHVEHPGKFYISPHSIYDVYATTLQEMNNFYDENVITVRINVVVNEVYAFYFENGWVRALVRNIVNEDLVELFLIDYGSETIAECLKLFPLKSEFKKIIPLAYECQLANISPVDGLWSKKAITYIKEKCCNTRCIFNVLCNKDNGSLSVFLSVNDKLINLEIVRKNFAVMAPRTLAIQTKKPPTSINDDKILPAPKLLISDDKVLPAPKLTISDDRVLPASKMTIPDYKVLPASKMTIPDYKVLPAAKLSISEDKVLPEPKLPTSDDIVLPPPKLLIKGMTIDGKLTHLINPSHFYVKDNNKLGEKMLREMNDYFKDDKKKSKTKGHSKTFYAAFYEDSWQRATVINKLNVTDDSVEVIFIDTGITTQMKLTKLKPLPKQFCHLGPLAYRCHLHEIIPVGGKWISKIINKTKISVLHKNCTITIQDEDCSSYGVLLSIDGISVNEKIIVKGFGEQVKKNEAPIDDIIPELMNQPMGAEEEDVSLSVAVQGYEANDEAEVCPHFKGPPHTTCFKGPRCKKKHQLLNPDGWTIKRIPALMEADQVFPVPNTLINIVLTSVITPKSFYGLIINDVNYFCDRYTTKEIAQLQRFLNCPSRLKSLKTYNKVDILPGIGELVAAHYSSDQKWYRAKICAIDENECEVFFIDFGNMCTLGLNQIAVLEKQLSETPPQAMCFLIDNIDFSFESPNFEDARNMLYQLLIDRIVQGYIESVEAHEICIRLYDNEQDIGKLMCEMGLVEEKPKNPALSEYQPISDDAVRLYCQLENIDREDFCHSQRLRLLPG